MRLSEEQFKALEPYDKNFTTIVKAGYVSNMDSHALDVIHGIYQQVVRIKYELNKGCGNCVKNLMRDMGAIYIKDKEEREALTKIAVKMPRQKRSK